MLQLPQAGGRILRPGAAPLVAPSQFVVPRGLVGYWPMSGEACDFAQALAFDVSGNNNHAALTGLTAATLTQGPVGTAQNYNGVTTRGQVATNAAIEIVADITLCAWVNPTSYAGYRGIFGKCTAGAIPASYVFYLLTTTGLPSLQRGNGTVSGTVNATAAPPTGTWSHVAVTMKGTAVTHYLNGAPNGSGTLSTTLGDTGAALHLGNRVPTVPMLGGAQEFRIYNRALDPWEIRAINAAGLAGMRTSGPRAP